MIEVFDAIAYLESRNVPYWTSGKNVTAGWVNIQCPKYDCDDASNHLGINLATGLHSCWKCGTKGGPEQLIMALEGTDWYTAHKVAQGFGAAPTYGLSPSSTPVGRPPGRGLLPQITKDLPIPHRKYLKGRGFNPDAIISKYGVGGCYNTGDRRFRMRIIIPIYMYGELVSFTARAISGKQSPKYRMPNDNEVAVPGGSILYGLDNVKNGVCALVEGPTDVWRIGDGAVAVMRTKFTEEQLVHIPRCGIHKVYVIYDSGAGELAQKLASRVSKLVPHVEHVPLPLGKDPATLNPQDLQQIRAWLRAT